jgi:hypothetical protein
MVSACIDCSHCLLSAATSAGEQAENQLNKVSSQGLQGHMWSTTATRTVPIVTNRQAGLT